MSAAGTSQPSPEIPKQINFLGHPLGLYVLFFTEMWERFSYYGMRALLVLFMVNVFKWTQEEASTIYKWYTSLVYLTPLLGGFLADRYLGNTWSIVIGGVMMAAGQFLLTQEDAANYAFFYTGLGLLIVGNGFFKPNMSVQVGRLYPINDPRRDGAYTIFYMGINVGAFLAPIVCGALRNAEGLGFKYGFAAAGVGMLLGLVVYLLGLPLIKELPPDLEYQPSEEEKEMLRKRREEHGEAAAKDEHAMTEEQAKHAPSATPAFSNLSPFLMLVLAALTILGGVVAYFFDVLTFDNMIASIIAGGSMVMMAWILSQLSTAIRDRVLTIYVLGVFVVLFWGAFEQAGNAMNVWAEDTTNRWLSSDTPPAPEIYPAPASEAASKSVWTLVGEAFKNIFSVKPVTTESFQSINPFAIVVFAPLFAWFWGFLAKRRIHFPIPAKMATGVFLVGLAFASMIWAAKNENRPSQTSLEQMPDAFYMKNGELFFYDAPDLENEEAFKKLAEGERKVGEPMIAQGGRMQYADNANELKMHGVLSKPHRDRILRASAPTDYILFVHELALASEKKAKEAKGEDWTLTMQLDNPPPAFEPKYLQGFSAKELTYDPATRTFTVHAILYDKEYKQILLAGANPELRSAVNDLFVKSAAYKVSAGWLLLFYVLCTLGELCLSPVGLSMVSKLSPRRFATMLMGIWLLTSFFGNFAAGLAGENWEYLQPMTYFTAITIVLIIAALICYMLVKPIEKMMHGVR